MKKIIYGAGDFGRKLCTFLQVHEVGVDYFCQTQVQTDDRVVLGVQVISIEQLQQIEDDKIVLIAIADEKLSKDIKKRLTSLCFERIEVYECGSFIKDNLKQIGAQANYCIMCNSYVEKFLPLGREEKIFESLHIIGGGYREKGLCPMCGSTDRERWNLYVLNKYTDIFSAECKVLHFAPEKGLMERIQSNTKCDYYSCDIEQGRAMHIVDVTDIQFKEETFDYIIINHVLEHIEDEEKAVLELKRVLKSNGKIIMSFPICMNQRTLEDKTLTTAAERLRAYGQDDHVRLYGNDYKERFEEYGLKIEIHVPRDEVDEAQIDKWGLIENDILMICQKDA